MFRKILIANRGEIACRVIETCRRLGIKTVAIYSDADKNARHVALADEAMRVGPSPVAESYLQADRIVEIALQSGAEAVHPGYGLLSENPEFVEKIAASGLVFVGPPASAIRAMGLKDAAKALMVEAGVPVVPGYHGQEQNPDFLAGEADAIGYPVLIKARAGGGGKGMRLVENSKDFRTALEGAQREAKASFGDAACLIEKYVTQPRHVEIQVFADGHGNAVHLFERDCSLQRRHQKVIEEAPAPDMPEAVRSAMGRAAVEAAKAIGYQGAGTVEFIVDGSKGLRADGFWFMEMNTRLQVEHPVSEAITGLDFVELQLRVAAGEALPFQQDDLSINGWAFEARIYAEDVGKGFLPATGRLDHLSFPHGREFGIGAVRIDSGVRQGDEISPFYDPMIAKVIVHAATRPAALNLLAGALAECHVSGVVTNIPFLQNLARHQGFRRGEVDTGLIARDIDALLQSPAVTDTAVAIASVLALGVPPEIRDTDPWSVFSGWRHWSDARQYVTIEDGDELLHRSVLFLERGTFCVEGGKAPVRLELTALGGSRYSVNADGHRFSIVAVRLKGKLSLYMGESRWVFGLPDALNLVEESGTSGNDIISPMPGLVTVMSAKIGQAVSKGDALIVLEAMKMEHTLTAPRDGIVAEVLAKVGDQVQDGMLLLSLQEDGEK